MSGRQTEATDGPVMLWALDEVANIAPIHDLPALISQAGGQRLQVMVGLQDLSQARSRWGADAAEGFMSLFQTKAVLSGIGDSSHPGEHLAGARRIRPQGGLLLEGDQRER